MRRWAFEEKGLAATEFSLLFPILMTLMVGVFDMGYGIVAAQKTIRSSQVIADLVARHKTITQDEINEAISGGELALSPFDTSGFGYDVISIEFDESGEVDMPVLWRETSGMGASDAVFSSLAGLGGPGDGLIIVQVRYEYEPMFGGYLFGTMNFSEIAFQRPRSSSSIPLAGAEEGA
ncbi:MAG: pilus assembly protein [Alphaproteobacteria bacterium]|nr:pilus assembly protein [Alphaproteobacteria bacterium]MCD8520004.1 pilus assembly protein [Alphaproteobacteria bacterium]MCD8571743.1 pilus assembly protein [Alphaproteobacteria bacterium]